MEMVLDRYSEDSLSWVIGFGIRQERKSWIDVCFGAGKSQVSSQTRQVHVKSLESKVLSKEVPIQVSGPSGQVTSLSYKSFRAVSADHQNDNSFEQVVFKAVLIEFLMYFFFKGFRMLQTKWFRPKCYLHMFKEDFV